MKTNCHMFLFMITPKTLKLKDRFFRVASSDAAQNTVFDLDWRQKRKIYVKAR
jgi:hypothetical protein